MDEKILKKELFRKATVYHIDTDDVPTVYEKVGDLFVKSLKPGAANTRGNDLKISPTDITEEELFNVLKEHCQNYDIRMIMEFEGFPKFTICLNKISSGQSKFGIWSWNMFLDDEYVWPF